MDMLLLSRKQPSRSPGREDGFILVVTMMVLVVLTILGIAALDSSVFELRISANDRSAKTAFNLADGSVYSTSKLLDAAISGTADPVFGPVTYTGYSTMKPPFFAVPNNPDDFYRIAMGFDETRTALGANPLPPDFRVQLPDTRDTEVAEVYIVGRVAEMLAGGGAEFGAGSAGAGVGSGGAGAAVTFDIDVEGFSGRNSRSILSARYRKVLGATGGM